MFSQASTSPNITDFLLLGKKGRLNVCYPLFPPGGEPYSHHSGGYRIQARARRGSHFPLSVIGSGMRHDSNPANQITLWIFSRKEFFSQSCQVPDLPNQTWESGFCFGLVWLGFVFKDPQLIDSFDSSVWELPDRLYVLNQQLILSSMSSLWGSTKDSMKGSLLDVFHNMDIKRLSIQFSYNCIRIYYALTTIGSLKSYGFPTPQFITCSIKQHWKT